MCSPPWSKEEPILHVCTMDLVYGLPIFPARMGISGTFLSFQPPRNHCGGYSTFYADRDANNSIEGMPEN